MWFLSIFFMLACSYTVHRETVIQVPKEKPIHITEMAKDGRVNVSTSLNAIIALGKLHYRNMADYQHEIDEMHATAWFPRVPGSRLQEFNRFFLMGMHHLGLFIAGEAYNLTTETPKLLKVVDQGVDKTVVDPCFYSISQDCLWDGALGADDFCKWRGLDNFLRDLEKNFFLRPDAEDPRRSRSSLLLDFHMGRNQCRNFHQIK